MADCAVTHLFTHIRGLSGVESMVRRHLREDGRNGLDSSAVAFFESGDLSEAGQGRPVSGLGLKGWMNGRLFRRRFRQARSRHPAGFRVYHDAWGIPAVADLDQATRRIAFLHAHWQGAEHYFPALQGLLDGIVCVCPPLRDVALQCLPGFPGERTIAVLNPVDLPPPGFAERRPARGPERVLGFCGRVVHQQKRVERLPQLARLLAGQGIRHRWEILGDGSGRPGLEQEFSQSGVQATFHGGVRGDAVYRILSGWDVIVFVSDFEGMPLALLEAASLGVLPLFPDIASGGQDLTREVAPELVYRAGDLADAARAVSWLHQQTPEAWTRLAARSAPRLALHSSENYIRTVASFLRQIGDLPRLSAKDAAARRRTIGEWMPFSLLGRLAASHPLRRGYA